MNIDNRYKFKMLIRLQFCSPLFLSQHPETHRPVLSMTMWSFVRNLSNLDYSAVRAGTKKACELWKDVFFQLRNAWLVFDFEETFTLTKMRFLAGRSLKWYWKEDTVTPWPFEVLVSLVWQLLKRLRAVVICCCWLQVWYVDFERLASTRIVRNFWVSLYNTCIYTPSSFNLKLSVTEDCGTMVPMKGSEKSWWVPGRSCKAFRKRLGWNRLRFPLKFVVEDLDVSKNSGTPKWMVYKGKPY